jgi:hypothetical protein
MIKYFFYNIYGDADHLVESAPEDVYCVKYGWDKQTEENRNTIVNQLNVFPSSLPCLMYYREEKTMTFPDGEEYIDPAGWKEISIYSMEKPWNWQDIFNQIVE